MAEAVWFLLIECIILAFSQGNWYSAITFSGVMTLYICWVVADKLLCLACNFLHRKKCICALIDECDNSRKWLKEIFILLHVVLLNDRNIILSGSHQPVWWVLLVELLLTDTFLVKSNCLFYSGKCLQFIWTQWDFVISQYNERLWQLMW